MSRIDWYIRANLKLRHLQLLVALDDLRSVGRVATHMHVTQPAVSKMLTTVETGLEMRLFERHAHGLEPTEQGACLVRHARTILDTLGSARAELQDIGSGKLTRVSLGVLPSTAIALVPRLVAMLEHEAQSRRIVISVREGTMETLLPALRAGDVDLVVGLLPAKPLGADYATEQLYEDPTVTVVRVGHPLASREQLAWKDLLRFPMILPPSGTLLRSAIDLFMAEQRLDIPRQHLDSVSTHTNLGVLELTDSVGFLPSSLAAHFESQRRLCILPFTLPKVNLGVGLIWMAGRREVDAARHIRARLRTLAHGLFNRS